MNEAEPTLETLRATLDELDSELLELVARRLEVVAEIGALKASEGRAVFDRTREQQVQQRFRARAEALGLPGSVGTSLAQTVIEASHDLQERTLEAVERAAVHWDMLIVGGGGLMGRRLGEAFAERGHRVVALEPDTPGDHEAMVRRADIVLIAVPMQHACAVAAKVAPWVRHDALLCDINSLKRDVCLAMATCNGEVLGTHPMFGPSVHALRRQKVVVCPVAPGPLTTRFLAELQRLGMELIEATPEEHDRMMAVVQVLVHFNTLVMGEALRRAGVSIDESLRYTSPIYRLELAFVGRLFAQNPELYAEIEMQNPFGAQVRRHYQEAVAAIDGAIARGDRAEFRGHFEQLADYFSHFANDAMALSDLVIDAVVAQS